MQSKGEVIVIGAGIIGLCSAYYLHQEGFRVTLLEQGNLINNCSSGNAGMIVPSHFIPLAAPGMISKGIKWMFDSKSPFYVKPSLDSKLLSWGLKFWKYSNEAHVERSAIPLRDLHLRSKALYEALAQQKELNFGLEEKGILMLYKNEAVGAEEIHVAQKAKELGLDIAILDANEVQALEPNARLDVMGAVHYRCDAHLTPGVLIKQLVNHLTNEGVKIVTHAKVKDFEIVNGKITAISTDSASYKADEFVMTGGAWLPELSQKAGLKIPVMPGKGYSFMVEPQQQIVHPSLLLEARVAVTPMDGKIRFGGTMEIAPINHQVNLNRVQGIVNAIAKYYPDYKVDMPDEANIWYGFRPCSPDGLPYIGRAQKIQNLIIAGGHGMMGVSLAPITGKLVAELASHLPLSLDIAMYKPDRFA